MTLVVEDGTGKDDANTYIGLTDANTYFTDRGITEWTGTDAVKEAALIRATDYIETRWGLFFKGQPEFPDTPQALSFPRLYIYNRYGTAITGVPENLRRATAEYALRALTESLLPDPVVSDSGQILSAKREKVGPIEEEVQYQVGAPALIYRPYPAADRLLAEYVLPGGRNYR